MSGPDDATRHTAFPVGAAITAEQLHSSPYDTLRRLREFEPVSWVPAIDGWLITRRDLALEAMRDAERFTVDDPRFTTAAVLGDSMLSLDGSEHARHRGAFADAFRPKVVRERFETDLEAAARARVGGFAAAGRGDLRRLLAGPFAVETIIRFLGLDSVGIAEVLDWYNHLSAAIVDLTLHQPISTDGERAVAQIHETVRAALANRSSPLLCEVEAGSLLTPAELPAEVAVIMFGAIETSEGMTANLLWHLLRHPEELWAVRDDPSRLDAAMEESLRLEPAASLVDRYTTGETTIGGVRLPEREKVTISLLGANRDPDVFPDPDRFDPNRANLGRHLAFVQGPHACIGLHLARLETLAAVRAAIELLPGLRLDHAATTAPAGLIFRKPDQLTGVWEAPSADS